MALTDEQLKNAQIIYSVGKQMGLGTRDIQIALITAMQESSLRNLHYGDRDSQGLFQQRPSQGWGTVAQVTDPVYASKKFYSSLRGLGDARYGMSMTEAAQAVQRSAYPDAYAKHIGVIRNAYPTISEGAGRGESGGPNVQPKAKLPRGLPNRPEVPYLPPEQQPFVPTDSNSLMASLSAPDNPLLAGAPDESFDYLPIISPSSFEVLNESPNRKIGFGKGVDGWRRAVVEAARTALGTPYTWGGNSLQEGVDCSGLIQQAFAKAGMTMPRVSYQQANYGQRVGLKALKPGDLVAWDNSSRNNGADHIALYIGNGRIIEAARPGTSVRIRKLGSNEGAWGVRIDR